ncbi:hypothetical protein INH39_18810 [Massilia violaceinigra]|uniref:Uncharacterized protein n=1 Tax=Massilia violaceinigra TaxID=2045208 RepID=A0ABY4A1W4_9BURK|nr:hypothetical protein [Massilia violaceinigra]UOD27566.1 hypothetical protein INH39_18810 [Massilia violaceinigra]
MNRSHPRCSVLLASLLCTIACAIAQPLPSTPKDDKVLRGAVVDGATLVLDGQRLVARLGDASSTHYFYIQGRLHSLHHSDGRFATYYYDDQQRLDRIEFSDGQVQRAHYQAGRLASIGNEAGQRLHFAAPVSAPAAATDVVALAARPAPQASAGAALAPPKAAPAAAEALNRTLIAVAGWEKNSWDCRFSPSEYSLCGGDGGGRGPFDGGGWSHDDGGPFHGGGWHGPDFAPYPMDLPTRMSCLAAATSTFEIMRDQVCSMVKDKAVCTAQNHQLFDELWKKCIAKYPN